jgi:hypothetical protein
MYKKRHIHNKIKDHIRKKEYSIITGARQTGKTTLLREFYRELKHESKSVYYLSFENVDVLNEINKHPENIFKFTQRPLNPLESGSSETIYMLIDEIQYAKDPAGFLKYLYDTYLENLKIIATGSSAFYIDRKFRDSLAGRKHIFTLHSLSFMEYLEFNERYDLRDEMKILQSNEEYRSLKRREIIEYLDHYLVYGGYPAVVLEEQENFKKERLLELKNSFVKRDLLESGIKDEVHFYHLMTLLAEQIGNLLNKNEISQTLGIHRKTLDHYIQTLEKCFHIHLIKPFYKNVRKELTKMPKIYFKDNGLRNALLNRFSPFRNRDDKGALLENYVFQTLMDKHPFEEIKFWRTSDGHEVDFVISSDFKTGVAYEVKFDTKSVKPEKYQKFKEHYPNIPLNFISYADRNGMLSKYLLI